MTQTSNEGTTVIDPNGTRFHLNRGDALPPSLELMWTHSQEARNHCVLLEKTLAQINGQNFPIIVGRRPSGLSTLPVGKENQMHTAMVIISIFII